MQSSIPGYTYGTAQVARSPVSLEELDLIQQTLLYTDDDARALQTSYEILKDQTDAILDVWYGFVGSHPHLLQYFTRNSDGQPDGAYLAAVRKRFGQWILDTASARYDQAWLDYQHEIGLRHHTAKKNATDGADASDIVHFRYLLPLVYPITATLRPFLAKGGHGDEQVERMQQAWLKSVLLQVTLWCHPYVKDGQF
jgi:hypothetical protein